MVENLSSKGTKRLNVDLAVDEFKLAEQTAKESGSSISGYVRELVRFGSPPKKIEIALHLENRLRLFTENGIFLAKRDPQGNILEVGPLTLLE